MNITDFNTILTTFFGVTFILSMFSAVGAIEENNFFLGAMLVVTGILTGTLTVVLQNNEK